MKKEHMNFIIIVLSVLIIFSVMVIIYFATKDKPNDDDDNSLPPPPTPQPQPSPQPPPPGDKQRIEFINNESLKKISENYKTNEIYGIKLQEALNTQNYTYTLTLNNTNDNLRFSFTYWPGSGIFVSANKDTLTISYNQSRLVLSTKLPKSTNPYIIKLRRTGCNFKVYINGELKADNNDACTFEAKGENLLVRFSHKNSGFENLRLDYRIPRER